MKKPYQVSVDGKYEFELSSEDSKNLDGIDYCEADVPASHKKSHIIHNQKSFSVEILKEDFNQRKYTVKINGNTYSVAIETPLDQLIKEMGLSLGNDSVEDEVHAPMPGIILEVNVAEGDEVKQGDFLCVLEAMKMENALTAPRDAIIKSVHIVKGDTVEKGKLLIEFKEND